MKDFARPLRGIVLDVDGTLLNLAQPLGASYSAILDALGISADVISLNVATKKVWLSFQGEYLNESAAFATTHEREEQVWKEYVRRVLREAGVPIVGEHLEQAVAAVYEAFSRGSSRRVASGAVEFLHAMQQSELPVVAATNNDRRVELVLEELGLTGYFDEIVTSGHLGWKKPSPYFFAGISNLLEIPAGELLHIGNDLELDVRAAQRAGFQGQFFGSSQDGESAIENFDALRLSVMQLVDAPRVGRE